MSGWGYDDDGAVDATPDAWGAAPSSRRPDRVSNKRDAAVGELFSPDEESPNEWAGAGAGGRWGNVDGEEDRDDANDAGGWGGDPEDFEDGDEEAHEWGRSDHARDDEPAGDGYGDGDGVERSWRIVPEERTPPETIQGRGDSDKENLVTKTALAMSKHSASPPTVAAPAPAPVGRKRGWKSSWAAEGSARARALSSSAPETGPSSREEKARERGREHAHAPKASSPIPSSPSLRSNSATEATDIEVERVRDAAREKKKTLDDVVVQWGSDCDSEDERLAGSGLTQIHACSPGTAARRAASLRAAVAARKPFALGVPPEVSTPKPKPAERAAVGNPATISTVSPPRKPTSVFTSVPPRRPPEGRTHSESGLVDLLDATDEEDAIPESDDESFETGIEKPSGAAPRRVGEIPGSHPRGRETSFERSNRNRDGAPGSSSGVGVGGPLSHVPRAPAPASPAAWRARLPHFIPASELKRGEYVDGEKVFIDYASQFEGGGGGGGGARGGTNEGRWFRDGDSNKFVDTDGEVLEGRAAWRASEKQKKSAAAAARTRR